MDQTSNKVTPALNPNVVPVGGGGAPGRAFRMFLMLLTGGFAFPNTFVEGMDLTVRQKETEGMLYAKDKKASAGKSRF